MENIVNIINFIRGVEPRPGRNIDLQLPMREQIRLMRENGLTGTFLLQYDALISPDFAQLIDDAAEFCEMGLWLEVVQPQVEAVGLKWRGRYPWDWHNDVGFLIGYEPDERLLLIDEAMERFKARFGRYPESVGSWHIDAVSLKYLDDKYGVVASCNCRDQVGTDGYTMQGGYYNQAYYPSVNNMFCPASTAQDQINIPVFRMLGSDPVMAYDYQVVDYGTGISPTLEPSQLARFNDWTDWFFETLFDTPNGLCFQYTQAGQENSFGWHRMEGLKYQFPRLAQMAKEGKIKIQTLGQSGRWYKERFKITPAGSMYARDAWKHPELASVWYYSRYYRANLLLEDGVARIRDAYIFDGRYRSHYVDKRCDTTACEFRNLPVMEGVLYSNIPAGIKAGIYLCANGERIRWSDMSYEETAPDTVKVTLTAEKGNAVLVFCESEITLETDIDGLELIPVCDAEKVRRSEDASERFGNLNNSSTVISFIDGVEVCEDRIVFSMNGFEYGVTVETGNVSQGFTLTPESGRLTVVMKQK